MSLRTRRSTIARAASRGPLRRVGADEASRAGAHRGRPLALSGSGAQQAGAASLLVSDVGCSSVGEHLAQLVAGDGLLGQQELRGPQQDLVTPRQDVRDALALLVDDPADLLVDGARGLLAVFVAAPASSGACSISARRSFSKLTCPSRGLMPNVLTMLRAMSVALLRSSWAPVDTSS